MACDLCKNLANCVGCGDVLRRPGLSDSDLRDRFAMAVAPQIVREMWGEVEATEQITAAVYDLAAALMAERARRRKVVPDAER